MKEWTGTDELFVFSNSNWIYGNRGGHYFLLLTFSLAKEMFD